MAVAADSPAAGEQNDHESAQQIAMNGVLDKLLQIRAMDPAAEQVLLEQLRDTPADSWPLVAEQFRSSLAYRQQLRQQAYANEEQSVYTPPQGVLRRLPDEKLSNPGNPFQGSENRVAAATAAPPSTESRLEEHAPEPLEQGKKASSEGPKVTNVSYQATSPAVEKLAAADSPADAVVTPPQELKLDWQQSVEAAIQDLQSKVSPSPASTAEVHQHVSLRLLMLLAGDTASALEPIPNIPPAEHDYWSKQIFALATYLDHHAQSDDKRRAAASVLHLDEAIAHLRELGSLSLRNLTFCREVHGYGALEPYESDHFSAGQQVTLYVEVENYHSESTDKGYCTSLGSSYELLNDQGNRIAGGEFPDVEDCCRSRRRDFHIQYGLTLPGDIAPGHYRLQLVVKDRQSDKLGSASVKFDIGDGAR